jgi:hypothetical protein
MSRENCGKPKQSVIATKFGWANPKTGELLVSRRGLPNPVEGYKPNQPFKPSKNVQEPPKIEIASEVKPAPVRKSKPPRRKVNDSQE